MNSGYCTGRCRYDAGLTGRQMKDVDVFYFARTSVFSGLGMDIGSPDTISSGFNYLLIGLDLQNTVTDMLPSH
jgi:hypothetical protein